jgi:hypothetical protein
MLLFEWASRIETVGFKLAEGKGLREGWDSKELWASVEKAKAPFFGSRVGVRVGCPQVRPQEAHVEVREPTEMNIELLVVPTSRSHRTTCLSKNSPALGQADQRDLASVPPRPDQVRAYLYLQRLFRASFRHLHRAFVLRESRRNK